MATRMATLLYSDGFFETDDGIKKTQPLPMNAPASRGTASITPDLERRREQVTLPEAPVPTAVARTNHLFRRASFIAEERTPLGALVLGIVLASAIWVGLAVMLFGLVYPMSFFAHAALVTIGAWIAAAGITFAFASRPQQPLPVR